MFDEDITQNNNKLMNNRINKWFILGIRNAGQQITKKFQNKDLKTEKQSVIQQGGIRKVLQRNGLS